MFVKWLLLCFIGVCCVYYVYLESVMKCLLCFVIVLCGLGLVGVGCVVDLVLFNYDVVLVW